MGERERERECVYVYVHVYVREKDRQTDRVCKKREEGLKGMREHTYMYM